MSEEIELKLLKEIKKLQRDIEELKGVQRDSKPTYQFSKITYNLLKKLVNIKKNLGENIFDEWFSYDYEIDDETLDMFGDLIEDNYRLIETYSEEDLKVNFIIPILNKVHFKSYENGFRDYYELPLRYETENFIFNGTTDFTVSKGLVESEEVYFFIQEFKKGQKEGYPEAQLLAELISAIELNNYKDIKGAYIIGSLWYFVILEKIDDDKYQYFVSQKFDSMRIEDLEKIYKNLLYIKEEITKLLKED